MKLLSTFKFPITARTSDGLKTVPATKLPTAPWVTNGIVENLPPPQNDVTHLVSWGVYNIAKETRNDVAMFNPALKNDDANDTTYGGLITPVGTKTFDAFDL